MPDLEGVEPESVGKRAPSASSVVDIPFLIEKAIAKLPPNLVSQAVDKKRKATSQDPGWQYWWWSDLTKKDFVQCIFLQEGSSC